MTSYNSQWQMFHLIEIKRAREIKKENVHLSVVYLKNREIWEVKQSLIHFILFCCSYIYFWPLFILLLLYHHEEIEAIAIVVLVSYRRKRNQCTTVDLDRELLTAAGGK